MYIRTKPSNIDVGGDIYIIDDDNFKIVDNGCGLEVWIKETNSRRYIKSQGDNLIEVLEENDIVFDMYGFEGMITKIGNDRVFFKSHMAYENEIDKVVTHEQYLPLAQEVK